MYQAIFFL